MNAVEEIKNVLQENVSDLRGEIDFLDKITISDESVAYLYMLVKIPQAILQAGDLTELLYFLGFKDALGFFYCNINDESYFKTLLKRTPPLKLLYLLQYREAMTQLHRQWYCTAPAYREEKAADSSINFSRAGFMFYSNLLSLPSKIIETISACYQIIEKYDLLICFPFKLLQNLSDEQSSAFCEVITFLSKCQRLPLDRIEPSIIHFIIRQTIFYNKQERTWLFHRLPKLIPILLEYQQTQMMGESLLERYKETIHPVLANKCFDKLNWSGFSMIQSSNVRLNLFNVSSTQIKRS